MRERPILQRAWVRLWMRFAGMGTFGRIAARLVTWFAPPHKARSYLASLSERGFVAPSATIYPRTALRLGKYVYIGDRVTIYQGTDGGLVEIGDRTRLFGDTVIETGHGAGVQVGAGTRIHPGCKLIAHVSSIRIGQDVGVSQDCAFYSYNHGVAPDMPVSQQPLESRGPITIGDHVWLGVRVTVLDGVRIGDGAVIGAGAIVTRDVPDGAIAVGVPARIVRMRSDLIRERVAP